MARRGSRADQYLAIAAFYGVELIQDMHNPHVPEFVVQHAARRAAHYALTALRLREKSHPKDAGTPVAGGAAWTGLSEARA